VFHISVGALNFEVSVASRTHKEGGEWQLLNAATMAERRV
jgi:hypothetical protein